MSNLQTPRPSIKFSQLPPPTVSVPASGEIEIISLLLDMSAALQRRQDYAAQGVIARAVADLRRLSGSGFR